MQPDGEDVLKDRQSRSIALLLEEGYSMNFADYLSRGIDVFKRNFVLMIIYAIAVSIVVAINLGPLVPLKGLRIDFHIVPSNSINVLILALLVPPLQGGLLIAAAKGLLHKKVEFSDLFKGFQSFAGIVLANLVIFIFWIVGTALCILPGIYLLVIYMLTVPLILDRGLSFWTAMETSRKIVSKQWLQWFSLGTYLVVLNLLGFIACYIGHFFTVPLTYCIWVAAYEDVVGLQRMST